MIAQALLEKALLESALTGAAVAFQDVAQYVQDRPMLWVVGILVLGYLCLRKRH